MVTSGHQWSAQHAGRMVFTELRPPIMASASLSQDSVSVDISPKLIQISENAPLARQESIEDESKAGEHQVLMNGDHHEAEELRHVVIVKESPASDVISAGSRPAPDVKVQISPAPARPSVHTKVEESPINEPIVIVKHKAQVLQPSENDESVLEKLLESDGTESNAESSRQPRPTPEEGEEADIDDRRIKYSAAKKLSQDLIVTVENAPDDELKVTEKLPEVLLVAEQLPERLKTGKNILARSASKETDNKEKEPTAPLYESSEMDDGGSTLTIGRADTIAEVTDGLQVEAGGQQPQREAGARVKTVRHEVALENESSCISPFFVGLYSSLGGLIIIMIGLNFWFGFHLLFFVGLLAVIALFGCILTEFNDFHNEPD